MIPPLFAVLHETAPPFLYLQAIEISESDDHCAIWKCLFCVSGNREVMSGALTVSGMLLRTVTIAHCIS